MCISWVAARFRNSHVLDDTVTDAKVYGPRESTVAAVEVRQCCI